MKKTSKLLALTLSASVLLSQVSMAAVFGAAASEEDVTASEPAVEVSEVTVGEAVETEQAQPAESAPIESAAEVSDVAVAEAEDTATLAATSKRAPLLDFEKFEEEMNRPDALAEYLNEQARGMYDNWLKKGPTSTWRNKVKAKIDRNVFPTDEDFFGVWDAAAGKYTKEGKLNYDFVSPYGYTLFNVEEAVKSGDYETAKAELLQYYRKINKAQGTGTPTTTVKERRVNDLLLQRAYIHKDWGAAGNFEMQADIADREIAIDVTDTVDANRGGEITMIVCAVHKDDYEAVFSSREGGRAPVIEAVVGGRTLTIPVIADGYVTGGDKRNDKSGGKDTKLYAREDGMDVLDEGLLTTTDTRRTFLRFSFKDINAGDVLTSATLKLYGHVEDRADTPRNDPNYSKMMMIATNSTGFSEDNLYFAHSDLKSYVYSYQGDENQDLQTMYWGMPASVCNPNVRMNQEPVRFSSWWDALARGFAESGNEDYARACFTYLYDFIKVTYNIEAGDKGTPGQHDNKRSNCAWGQLLFGGYSCTLDASTRASGVTKNFKYLYDSAYLTPEVFTNFIKYFWAMGDLFVEDCWTSSEDGGNWGTAQVNGHMAIYANFPEIVDYEGIVNENGDIIRNSWSKAMSKHLLSASGSMIHDDGSSHELSHSYTSYALGTQLGLKDQAEAVGLEFEYDENIIKNILSLTKYMMRMALPGGNDPQYGDAGSYDRSYMSDRYRPVGEWLEDPELLWFSSNGLKGKKPNYTSYYYPTGKTLAMRDGWDNQAMFLHITADAAEGTHSHWDDGGIIVAAYGNYLLSDQGYNGYDVSSDSHRWLVSSRGHNVVEINDYCQNSNTPNNMDSALNKGGGKKGDFPTVDFNDTYDFTTVDLTNVYKNLSYRADPVIAPGGNGTPPVEQGMEYKRNILFLKNKFWIVSDYMNPVNKDKENKYSQYWHMIPQANISIDGQYVLGEGESVEWKHGDIKDADKQIANTQFVPGTGNGAFKSNFPDKANIQVVPVDINSVEPKLCYGYYESAGSTPYGRFDKYATGTTGFDTILFPTKAGETYAVNPTPVEVKGFNTEDTQGAASAFTANIKAKQAATKEDYDINYFLLHEKNKKDEEADMTFGKYATDGTLAYYEVDRNRTPRQVIMQNGKHLADTVQDTELIYSTEKVENVTVTWQGSNLVIEGDKKMDLKQFTAWAPYKPTAVTFNGENVPFNHYNGYVYFGDEPLLDSEPPIAPPEPTKKPGNGSSGSHGSGNGNISRPGYPDVVPTVPPTQGPNQPADVFKAELDGHWAEKEISALVNKGIINGSEGSLHLLDNVTRAEFTKMVLGGIGAEPTQYRDTFGDVSADAWYAGYMQTAADMGIIEGYDGNASPEQPITRDEAVKIMMTALATKQEVNYSDAELTFNDSDSIADWATKYVATAVELGLINGMEDNTFQPEGNTLREQSMVMTYRLMEKLSLI